MESSRPTLTILSGEASGAVFALPAAEQVLVGSGEACQIVLNLPQVSAVHARIEIEPGGLVVHDRGSEQGVAVNDDRIIGPTWLHNGDILWLGTPGDPSA